MDRYKYRDKIDDKTSTILGGDANVVESAISEWAGSSSRANTSGLWDLATRKFGGSMPSNLSKPDSKTKAIFDKWYSEIQQPELRKLYGNTVKAYRGLRGKAAEDYIRTGMYQPKTIEDWTLSEKVARRFSKGTAIIPIEQRAIPFDPKKGVVIEKDIPVKNILASSRTARLPMGEDNIIVAGLPTIKVSILRPSNVNREQKDERSGKAIIADVSKLAKTVVPKGDPRWLKHPGRFDIREVDTPTKRKPKTKRQRARTAPRISSIRG